jgi:hypothetical protein
MTTYKLEKMPAGYNDEESRYFIPEELRDEYSKNSGQNNFDKVNRQTKILIYDEAEGNAARRLGENAYTLDRDGLKMPTQQLEELAEKLFDEFSETKHFEMVGLAQHQVRLSDAGSRVKQSQRRAEVEAQNFARFLCPVCNVSDPVLGMGVTRRVVATGERASSSIFDMQPQLILSCVPCWAVAQQIYVESMASLRFEGKLTRRNLVERALR